MLDDKSLLELCVNISGAFENGSPSYTAIAGNFDGMGLSCGILQWNAGQGTLQALVQKIGIAMGWDKAQTFFHSDIHHFSILKPQEAIQWCLDHYVATGTTQVDPAAKVCWQNFLGQPESIQAQIDMATNGVLYRAKVLAGKFCPDYPNRTRVMSFFFDLVTQSGGMENSHGHVDPLPSGVTPDITDALAYANSHNAKCAGMWETVTPSDPLSVLLIWYAYQRSLLSNALYVWDAFSRRGSIGARLGFVHGTTVNFTAKLD